MVAPVAQDCHCKNWIKTVIVCPIRFLWALKQLETPSCTYMVIVEGVSSFYHTTNPAIPRGLPCAVTTPTGT